MVVERADSLRFAVMPGDGVGPEVVAQAERVLDAASSIDDLTVELVHYPHRQGYLERDESQISDSSIRDITASAAILFGAQGGPMDGSDDIGQRPLVAISNALDLSVGVRSARLHSAHLSPLRNVRPDLDVLIVRDTSEDCFAMPGGTAHREHVHEVSVGLLLYTRHAVDRVVRHALEAANRRRGRLHLVTQVEGVPAHQIWHRRLDELAPRYPDVAVRRVLPDTAAALLVNDPESLDVVVTTYWLGGILSNLLGAVAGGVSAVASARMNPDLPFGLFEPAHGTAPSHTGKGTASPVASIRAMAMMLNFVGASETADRIERAVDKVFHDGWVHSLRANGVQSTSQVGDAVIRALEADSC